VLKDVARETSKPLAAALCSRARDQHGMTERRALYFRLELVVLIYTAQSGLHRVEARQEFFLTDADDRSGPGRIDRAVLRSEWSRRDRPIGSFMPTTILGSTSARAPQDAGKGDCSGCACRFRLRNAAEIRVMTSPIGKGSMNVSAAFRKGFLYSSLYFATS